MSSYKALLALTNTFELYLGNPKTQETPVNFQESLVYDEQEQLAWPQIRFIQDWGFMEYFIPHDLGGKFSALEELYFIVKSIGRRDLTTTIALGISCLAALPVWIAGTPQQRHYLAMCFRRGDAGAFALTEEAHGSDAAANEVNARSCAGGWLLSGTKWCINFATLSQFVTIVCRTHEKGGPLGFSVFLVDKSQITSGFKPIPKLPTHGVRGLDISGFELDNLFVPKEALVGEEKRGLEIAYKTLQVSRALCGCFAVSGADTALRLALSFSLQRQLYGKPAFALPVVKQRLGEQFTQLLIADCTTLAVIRACSIMPEKLSLWSAIIKFLIPKIAEDVVEQSGVILGARAYLRTTEWAIFQKIRRDVQVVGLFDGSSQVNLSLIAGNLVPQANMRGTFCTDNLLKLEQIFSLQQQSPPFNERKLGLFSHSEDDILAGLGWLQSTPLTPLITAIRAEIARLDQDVLHLKEQKLFEARSLSAFRLAERYCWIFAASCCLHFWHFNQNQLVPELQDIDWLTLAMQLILDKLTTRSHTHSHLQESMAERLVTFFEQNYMFSVLPTQLSR